MDRRQRTGRIGLQRLDFTLENFAAAGRKNLEEIKKRHAGANALRIIESYKEERKILM